ncbi:hypothetical protein B0H14DRAFT_2339355 [Mycena olivaceomarginata]|nr:hypothetical protein B0H14DRAFT_2339355 [Mycena olivaceomarginata]
MLLIVPSRCQCAAHNLSVRSILIHLQSTARSATRQNLRCFICGLFWPFYSVTEINCGPHHGPRHITPSGRALAIGMRVQNVSTDPNFQLMMLWPDNEPFP